MRKLLTFLAYGPTSRSWATVVTQTGITLSVLGNGLLKGGSRLLTQSQVDRLLTGQLLVTTPHRAGGSFSERRLGGVYPIVKATAKWKTLHNQLLTDPRQPVDGDGKVAWKAILHAYGRQSKG